MQPQKLTFHLTDCLKYDLIKKFKCTKKHYIFAMNFNKLDDMFQLLFLCTLCLLILGKQEFANGYLRNENFNRMQRRFMWKQMDHSIDGMVDSMVSSARAMKNMIGDLLPSDSQLTTPPTSDYLPMETIRVKYIIRNPRNNKPIKIIKVRPQKKLSKIHNFPSSEMIRQLEKQQEIISEEHLLSKPSIETQTIIPLYTNYNLSIKKSNEKYNDRKNMLVNNWVPVKKNFKTADYTITTVKPQQVSQLHTVIHGESLPEPEKLVHKTSKTLDRKEILDKRLYEAPKNTYEVTEYAEESVAAPVIQYHDHTSFLPSSQNSQFQVGQTSSTAVHITSTSTEDPPNYPVLFLKKYRERVIPKTAEISAQIRHNTSKLSTSWIPISYSTRSNTRSSQNQYFKSHKKASKISAQVLQPGLSTETPLRQSQIINHNFSEIANNTTKSTTILAQTVSPKTDKSQRGSVKFGDKLILRS